MPCRNKLNRALDGQVRPHRLAGDERLRQRIGRSAVALALGTKQDAWFGRIAWPATSGCVRELAAQP